MSKLLEYLRLCRLCLVKENVNVPIFADSSDVRQIFLKISACLPVKVSQDDNLPKHICDSCLYKVDLLYQFWNTSVNAEKQLIQWITELGLTVTSKKDAPVHLMAQSQSHSQPHSITETIMLKEEHLEMETQQQHSYSGFDIPYQPEVNMTVGASADLDSALHEDVKVGGSKRRGRPPKQKVLVTLAPPVSVPVLAGRKRRSSATKAAAAFAAHASSDDSDADDKLASDTSEPDFEPAITKEEADSEDEEYVDNPDSLEPTTFVDASSTCDPEQAGPSGLMGAPVTTRNAAMPANTEPGLNVDLPPGIRIKRHENGSSKKPNTKTTQTQTSNTKCSESGSVYKEFLSKIGHLTIKAIKPAEETSNLDGKDVSNIVDNLTKCGLVIKKIAETETTSLENTNDENTAEESNKESEDDESEYEIETLDDEDDIEYIPELKKRAQDKDRKPQKKTKEFMEIISTNYMCIMCHQKFPSMDLLTEHMKNPTPCRVLIIKCPICGKEFPNKSRCSSHMHSHKEKQKFPCTKCKKQFSTQVALQIHVEFNHTEHFDSTEDGWKCKLCDYICDSRLRITHHVNGKHLHISAMLCDICGKSFVRESSLRAHIMTHRETRSYLCQICNKGFKMKSSLRAHVKTHNLEKRFVCDECGKSFKKNCTLTEHKKYHAGDFSYPCLWCDKRFVSKSLLNTHMKNHAA